MLEAEIKNTDDDIDELLHKVRSLVTVLFLDSMMSYY